jgi:Fe2+ or Zn2+ uptake regulation protein
MRTHEYRDIICSLCNCKHLTAEEVFLEVKKIEPKIGKATVYRNLEDMSSSGMKQLLVPMHILSMKKRR